MPGSAGADESRGRHGAARAPRQALVARPDRGRPARATIAGTRWTARSWRRSAGGTRPRSRTGSPATVDWFVANEALVAGDPVGRLGRLLRAPVRRPPGRLQPGGLTMRVAVTGARRPARSGPRRGAGRCAVHRARRADRLDPRGVRPRRAGRPSARGSTRDRPEVVVHAAAWTDVDGCARDPELALRRNGDGDRCPRRADARRGASTSIVISTNEVFDGRRTDGRGYTPGGRAAPRRTRTARRSWRARWRRARRSRRAGRGRLGDRPDGLALRAAGRRLPGQDPRRGRPGRRRPASRCRLVGDEWGCPTYVADVAEAIVELLAAGGRDAGIHHVVNGGSSRRGPTGRATSSGRAGLVGRRRGRPGDARGARLHPAALGRPRADAAAGRRAAPTMARRDGRLRADPAPRPVSGRGRPPAARAAVR